MNKKLAAVAAGAAASLSLNINTAVAQQDTFLSLQGIDGGTQNDSYKGQIDVLAWSWGLSNSGNLHTGFGGGVGRPSFQDVTVTKFTDQSSPALYQAIAEGSLIKEGKLTVTRPSGKAAPFEATIFTMKDILVSSAATGGTTAEDRPTESISLNFREFCIQQNTLDESGKESSGDEFCFDISKGVLVK